MLSFLDDVVVVALPQEDAAGGTDEPALPLVVEFPERVVPVAGGRIKE